MEKTKTDVQTLFDRINSLYEEFNQNHAKNIEDGTKAAGTRARKAIGEIKKLATDYRKSSIQRDKS
jgi:outer membrane murein-binding lipoprotein Lpp